MDIATLYVGQGSLAVVRTATEALIVDAHYPETPEVTREQISATLRHLLQGRRVVGLMLTGLDRDHAHPDGVQAILEDFAPDWVMYPTYYKETDSADDVFAEINAHVRRRAASTRPLRKVSVRVDRVESRQLSGLSASMDLELFSPHIEDMDSSNNSSIVVKVTGREHPSFSYLITGDTETERWETMARLFGGALKSDVLAAPHHGSRTGVSPVALLKIAPELILVSAGVESQFDHPHPEAVRVYSTLGTIHATNAGGQPTCLLTRRTPAGLETRAFYHQ